MFKDKSKQCLFHNSLPLYTYRYTGQTQGIMNGLLFSEGINISKFKLQLESNMFINSGFMKTVPSDYTLNTVYFPLVHRQLWNLFQETHGTCIFHGQVWLISDDVVNKVNSHIREGLKQEISVRRGFVPGQKQA